MEREYTYLLHLLGAYLRGEKPEAAEGIDWQKLMQLAQIHNVMGVLGCMCMKYPICPDDRMKAALRSVCLNTMSLFARRNTLAQELVEELEKAGIDHILMKGYVLRDYYPVPELRTFNDIDLVIRPEDRQRSHELMLSRGYRTDIDWEPVFTYFAEEELYEFHTRILEIDVSDKADYRGYFLQMWDHARPVSGHGYRFTPEFHFLFLLTHIAKHVHGSGAGARMYLDVAAFLLRHGGELDWPWIGAQLRFLKLDDFAAVVLAAVEEWFGVACPVSFGSVERKVLDEFCIFTMEAGVFGHHDRDGALAGLKNADQEGSAPRLRQLLRRAFPKAETIQNRYTYLQEKPWLLPAAWVHRLVNSRETLGRHTQEAREIFSADSSEIRRLQKLMRDIGL